MLGLPDRARRDRYRQLVAVLGRHGMGALVSRLGLGSMLPFHHGLFGRGERDQPLTTAEHLRVAIEELGTTAIKLGQILSTRPDLIPAEYAAELEKLRDHVPPVATSEVVAVIERELCSPLGEVFAEFEEQPLAAASIGQVHAAVLHDGTRVVVKVRKPGVAETVASDLTLFKDLAVRGDRTELFGQTYHLEALADDFAWTLRAELDYVREGRNAERLRDILQDMPSIVVPAVHWRFTTREVLVLDRLEGVRIDDIGELDRAGIDRRCLANTLARALLTQIFEAGYFHADPHPGNFLVLADGRIGMLDFGMVGQLDGDLRHNFIRLLLGAVRRDAQAVTDGLETLGVAPVPATRAALRRDIERLLDRYYGVPAGDVDLHQFIVDLLAIVRSNRLQLPTELALVLKTLMMAEGLWRRLDPKFNAATVAGDYVQKALRSLYSPGDWGRRTLQAGTDLLDLGTVLPGQLRRIAMRLDRGDFEVTLRHRDIDEALNRASSMVTRLSTAVVTAAFIVGLPALATTYEPPGWSFFAPLWFFAGIGVVVALLVRLVIAGRGRARH